ncbi:cysteine desulfurase family protein [Lysinibacillus endophyticus]|uniref:Cysteine desulfurase n=1 Tax=Ureibacillus endophyticus TaxID=1978490 RepID=A0A494ZBA7_9BACL|nr:cysteine desulfurase family protein [Lysinibacillus endophyticus]MCP1145578.1 cysteine desulfurase [Lysinibacillus endophyticus]RKQ20032.1 cysteine desulfurase [Lysinibacillus endophyticus]
MIYLDNSATTKPYKEVLNTFIQVNESFYANPASIHEAGVESNTLLDRARAQMAKILGTDDRQVLFTAGGTESNNFAIFGIAKANTHKGKHIITTEIEHASVLESIRVLQADGYEIDYLSVDSNGVISLQELQEKLRKDTVLVSIMHVNNEMGAIQPIEEAAKIIHESSRATFHVDAVQSFGKMPIYFKDDAGPDIISISGHKIHGLKGSGVIAFRKKMNIAPLLLGGGQEYGLRSGTVAVPQAVALAKAARMAVEDLEQSMKKYRKWHNELMEFLTSFGSVIHILSTPNGAAHILSFSVKDLKGEILINALQKRGIIVSTSSACSSKQKKTSHVVLALKTPPNFVNGVIRLSFGGLTTDEDIQQFKKAFTEVMKELKGE